MKRIFRVLFFISLPIALAGLFFSNHIILLVFGAQYIHAVTSLKILLWSVFTVFINIPFATLLLASGKQMRYLMCVSIGACVNFGLNLLLIPRLSHQGAAIATIVTEIVVLVLLYVYSRKEIHIAIPGTVLRGVICSAALGAFFYTVSIAPIVEVLLGAILYGILLKSIGGFSKEDVTMVVQVIKNRGQRSTV